MHKKSQSLSINTIIIAAIGLAVLVVLFLVFTGRFKIFSEGIEKTGLSCKESCKLAKYSDGNPGTSCDNKIGGSFSDVDPKKNEVCCCVP
ncbi:hypothetical protein HYT53_05970 [Candidatus Woesearchaeota archaeon]|nr:hypothetical protein [Candidatus Woesearchaeota archaeon]